VVSLGHAEHRYLRAYWRTELFRWFSAIESKVWDMVDRDIPKPDKIFLVTGQVLASEFALCHNQSFGSSVTFSVSASKILPAVIDSSLDLQTTLLTCSSSTSATSGFTEVGEPVDDVSYCVFLQIVESHPPRRTGGFAKSMLQLPVSRFLNPFKKTARVRSPIIHFTHR
jgi:hypothetical protein